jgi:hypothetical protein
MAHLVAAVLVFGAGLAVPAQAFSLDVPRLAPPTLVDDAAPLPGVSAGGPGDLFFSTPSLIVPQRYSWVVDDGRAFWYSAGASAVVALGTHVLVGLPVTVMTVVGISTYLPTATAVLVPVLVGVGAVYFLGEAALSAAAATMVFNGASDVYQTNYLTALAAHVGGAVLGAGVSALTFGIGGALYGGLGALAEFTGSAGLNAVAVFSLLGSLPAVVIGGIALVGVPAVIGAWALAVTATAKDGYAIDPHWRRLPPTAAASPGDAPTLTIATLALPAP